VFVLEGKRIGVSLEKNVYGGIPVATHLCTALVSGNELLIVDKNIGGNKRLPLLTSKKHRRMFC
jgi:hypothetical protein